MNLSKEVIHVRDVPSTNLVLAADIGGTNSRFGLFFTKENRPVLALEVYLKSADITDFAQTVAQLLVYFKTTYQLVPRIASFAIAGAISADGKTVKPTNLSITIDSDEIKQKTGLEEMYLINDFQAIGYGIPVLVPHDWVTIRAGVSCSGTQIIIGAGTGLGKALVLMDDTENIERVIPSEGGHADFVIHTPFDYEFMHYCQQQSEHSLCIISWENVLAGRGIVTLYRFLLATRDYPDNSVRKQLADECTPEAIFAHRVDDPACADVYSYYGQWYGRCIKNFALEALAYGGIFIAGGIAANNSALFSEPFFMGELTGCALQARLIADMPIKVILNTNVGLYGAAYYVQKKNPTA